MDKKEQLRLRRIICNVLKKDLLDHPVLCQMYGDETPFKREYINSLGYSITMYLMFGRCIIAPEFNAQYIQGESEKYSTPETLYYDKFALDPDDPATVDNIADILAEAFYDERENVIGAAQNVIAKIKNV